MCCGTCPVIATSGVESRNASAMPVTRFVAPGPEVAITTPARPVARAYPSAANTPPCSCRGRIVRIFFERVSAWCIAMLAPPGYAKIVVTPSRSSASTRMSAPVMVGPSSPLLEGACVAGFVDVLMDALEK